MRIRNIVETGFQNTSDEELARQAQAGALSCFEELVYRYETRIYRFLVQCCRNESDAEELAQITFVTAHRSIRLYTPPRPFGTWLFTIARHKFIDHCRAARPSLELDTVSEASHADDPSAILVQHEKHRDVWQWARRLLGSDQFSALWLKYQEDLDVREIARVLKRTQTSVKVLLFGARQTLLSAATRQVAAGEERGESGHRGFLVPAHTRTREAVPQHGGSRGREFPQTFQSRINRVAQGWAAQPGANLSPEIK